MRALMRAQAICDKAEEAEGVVETLADVDGLASAAGGGAGGPARAVRATSRSTSTAPPRHSRPRPMLSGFSGRCAVGAGWPTRPTSQSVAQTVYRPDLFSLAARMEDLFIPADPMRGIALPETTESGFAPEIGSLNF